VVVTRLMLLISTSLSLVVKSLNKLAFSFEIPAPAACASGNMDVSCGRGDVSCFMHGFFKDWLF